MWLFATVMAMSIAMLAAQDKPFTGQLAFRPDPLLQVIPNGH